MIKNYKRQKGFTLIEMMVSLALFGVVVAIALGALTFLFNTNSRARSIGTVINNLNYSVDTMSRVIRFATNYHCGSVTPLTTPNSCSGGSTSFAVSTSSNPVLFRWNGTNRIELSYDNGSMYIPVTSPDITINYAQFYVFNTTVGDVNQPYVLINIRGYAGNKPSVQSSFDIQTVVSQKTLDI